MTNPFSKIAEGLPYNEKVKFAALLVDADPSFSLISEQGLKISDF